MDIINLNTSNVSIYQILPLLCPWAIIFKYIQCFYLSLLAIITVIGYYDLNTSNVSIYQFRKFGHEAYS